MSSPQQASANGLLGVYPCLTYHDLRRAVTWLQDAFGFDGQILTADSDGDQPPEHALLRTNDGGTILVEAERPEELHGAHAGQSWIYVAVTDADAHYHRAQTAGAQTLGEPHDFGDQFRGYSARDPEHNLWTFGTAKPSGPPSRKSSKAATRPSWPE